MSKEANPQPSPTGPYKRTVSTTVELATPIKFTTTTVTESTHAEFEGAEDCGCGGGNGGATDNLMDLFSRYAAMGAMGATKAPGPTE